MYKWTSSLVEKRGDHAIYREELGDNFHYKIHYRGEYCGVAFTMCEVNRIIKANNAVLDIEDEFFNAVGVKPHQVEEAVA